MQAQAKELLLELCERAATEQDPTRFLTIIREINVVLEMKSGRLRKGGPQFPANLRDLARCSMCDKPVSLETSKTDEHGKAVHEECYLLQLRLKQPAIAPKI